MLLTGLCWPSKEDIQEKLEYEAVAYPFTIKEMMETAAKKKRDAQLAIEKREQELAVKFEKLAIWKKELQDRIAKKAAEVQAAKVFIYHTFFKSKNTLFSFSPTISMIKCFIMMTL